MQSPPGVWLAKHCSDSKLVGSNLSKDDLALMTKVARMYYEQKVRQPEIAARLSISQSRVSRLLTQAQHEGIVRITVVSPTEIHDELGEQLRELLGLRDVVVAHVDDSAEESLLLAIGSAGANYLESTLSATDRVGLSSWSATLLAVADAMVGGSAKASQIVQIQGGVGNPTAQVQATRLTDQFARMTSAEPRYLAAPGLVASEEVRDGLLADKYIGEVVDSWDELSVALLGIGGLQPSPLLKDSGNTISKSDLDKLRIAGAVGDVSLHFFDGEGQVVNSALENRIIGISAKQLFAVPRRIGFAGGQRKIEAIYAAAKGGWIDVLITDSVTAKALLKV